MAEQHQTGLCNMKLNIVGNFGKLRYGRLTTTAATTRLTALYPGRPG